MGFLELSGNSGRMGSVLAGRQGRVVSAENKSGSTMLRLSGSERTKREFEELTLDHLDSIYAAALRLTKDERDAEDLVQDAYLRAYRFFDKFERGTNIKA